jgi:hypothetical protein
MKRIRRVFGCCALFVCIEVKERLRESAAEPRIFWGTGISVGPHD